MAMLEEQIAARRRFRLTLAVLGNSPDKVLTAEEVKMRVEELLEYVDFGPKE